MPSSQSINTINTPRNASATIERNDDIRHLGYEMGKFAAEYWGAVKNSERFRYMTIVDYRDHHAVASASTLTDQTYSGDFLIGFEMGFDDEAYDRAEAGEAGFEDVAAAAGSVDGSVAVTARRLLRLAADAGLRLD